jgi:hypothetical protein
MNKGIKPIENVVLNVTINQQVFLNIIFLDENESNSPADSDISPSL